MNLVRQEPEWVSGKRNSVTLSGAIQFGVLGESRSLAAGAVIVLDKGIPHDIQVLQDSELLLTIAKEVKWASAESGSGLPLPGLVKPVRGIQAAPRQAAVFYYWPAACILRCCPESNLNQ